MKALEDTSIMRVVKTLAKTKVSSLAIDKLEQLANKVGVDEKELFELYIETKIGLKWKNLPPPHTTNE